MDVDETPIPSSLPPSDAVEPEPELEPELEPEPEPEPEPESPMNEDYTDADDTQTQNIQSRHGSQEEDKDPLDIISLFSRSPSSTRSNVPVVNGLPSTSDQVDADADDEGELGIEKEDSLEPPSQAAIVGTSQEVKDDSPSPSPSPQTPLPTEDILVSPSQLLNSPTVSSKPPPAPVIVRISSSQQEHQPSYSFVEDSPPPVQVRVPPPSPPSRIKAATRYTLPPVSALPLELQKKGKPPKLRKRDRDKERSGSDGGKKEEWTPLGMARWAAVLRANPVFKRVSRASKCVSTRDWNVSIVEIGWDLSTNQ